MKKSFPRIFGILVVGIIILGVLRFTSLEDTRICDNGQRIMHGNPDAAMPTEACATSGEIDLTNCISYFDGCNNCSVKDGKPDACTLMYCETPSEPKCNEYATGSELTGDTLSGETKTNVSTFSDPELGISFSYPSSRGTITQESESNNGSKYLIMLLKNGNTFFVFHNGGTPLARGAFWGDSAQSINSSTYISNFCTDKTDCTLHTNSNGIPYVKYNYEAGIMGSNQTKPTLSYYLFTPNSSFRGMILSNDRIPEVSETDLDAIIESIQLN